MANVKRLWSALLNSIDGLKAAWRDEPAFRQEVIPATLLIPLAVFIAPNNTAMALMISSIFVVLIAELLNTAIEATVNRIGLHRDDLAKKAKDAASAAVFVALVNAAIVWIVVLV